jgi:1,4-alpha-glucan branching enzyme
MTLNIRTTILVLLVVTATASVAHATAVTFRYRAPTPANSVNLAGSFNQWDTGATPMENVDGVWEVTVDLPPGRHQYKYVVDGSEWITDEWALEFSDDGFGGQNSVVVVEDEPMVVGYGSREGGPGAVEIDTGPQGTPVTFRFEPTDRVNAVSLAGEFDDWDAATHVLDDADGDGVWEITIELTPGTYAYQFVVDGDTWIDAGTGGGTEPDGFGGRRATIEVGEESVTVGP